MKFNVEQIKRRRSVYVLIEQIRDDLRPVISGTLKDTVDDVIYDRGSNSIIKESTVRNLNHMLNFNSWKHDELVEMWCEVCSDAFFKKYSSVDDVFLLKSGDNSGMIVDAEWLASRGF